MFPIQVVLFGTTNLILHCVLPSVELTLSGLLCPMMVSRNGQFAIKVICRTLFSRRRMLGRRSVMQVGGVQATRYQTSRLGAPMGSFQFLRPPFKSLPLFINLVSKQMITQNLHVTATPTHRAE